MTQDNKGTQTKATAGAYQYMLEPYKGPDTRHTCPACGTAHKFARYIDTTTGEYIAEDCGRCDREDSCGYHLKPRDYFNANPERRAEYKPMTRSNTPALVEAFKEPLPLESYTIPVKIIRALYDYEAKAQAEKLPSARRWPYKFVERNAQAFADMISKSAFASCGLSSELAGYLRRTLDKETFRQAIRQYHLASWRGAAVFWYIDKNGRIRAGKAMYYKENGHRDKNYHPFFMHAILKAQGYLPESWQLRRCLFGEHLLAKDPAAPVALVESEKTAIIANALIEGPALWLASGGLHYLNADSCAGLKGREVVAYPDLGAYDRWKQRLSDLADKVGFRIKVSDYLERTATPEEKAAGLDIADYLTKEIDADTGAIINNILTN